MSEPSIYDLWMDGDITDVQALRALCSELGEVESELELLGKDRETLRAQLSHIVGKMGTQDVPGFGRLEITSPSKVESFSREDLNLLVAQLKVAGHKNIADMIETCKRWSERSGSLRITRERQR